MEANRTLSRAFCLLASKDFSRYTQCQSGRGECCGQTPERKDLLYLQFAHACLMRLMPCADSKDMSIAEIIPRDRDGVGSDRNCTTQVGEEKKMRGNFKVTVKHTEISGPALAGFFPGN